MFSSVESLTTNRAYIRLVASSIIAIRYIRLPRPSSQSWLLVSHCTSSPNRLRRRRRGVCSCPPRHQFSTPAPPPAPLLHFRNLLRGRPPQSRLHHPLPYCL